jgi:early secretory antigenic target protein ESAT-6
MSIGSEIKVTFGALAAAQSDVSGTASRITKQLEDLRRFLAPMVATWQGAAAQDYQVRQKQWDTAAADLTVVLGQIGVALGAANDGYRQAEHANAARWR